MTREFRGLEVGGYSSWVSRLGMAVCRIPPTNPLETVPTTRAGVCSTDGSLRYALARLSDARVCRTPMTVHTQTASAAGPTNWPVRPAKDRAEKFWVGGGGYILLIILPFSFSFSYFILFYLSIYLFVGATIHL
jgi:hypothetical protein